MYRTRNLILAYMNEAISLLGICWDSVLKPSVSRRVSYSRFGCYHVILEHPRHQTRMGKVFVQGPTGLGQSLFLKETEIEQRKLGDSPARNNITDQNLLGLHVDSPLEGAERPQPPAF